jgi:hypothetical protein
MILSGDSGDGVPNILSPDDIFITEGVRQKAMGDKKRHEILYEIGFDKWLNEQGEEIKRNAERNKKLIDLSLDNIPIEIIDNTWNEYNNCIIVKDPQLILNYFIQKQMQSLYDCVDDFLIDGEKSGLTYIQPAVEYSDSNIPQNAEDLFS